MKVFESVDGKCSYIVFKDTRGAYHVYAEVEAKSAAISCGSKHDSERNTRTHWNDLWISK